MHEQINLNFFRGTPMQISGTLSLHVFLCPESSSCFSFPEVWSMFSELSKNFRLCLNYHSLAWKCLRDLSWNNQKAHLIFFLYLFSQRSQLFIVSVQGLESSYFTYFVLISVVYGKRTIPVAITTSRQGVAGIICYILKPVADAVSCGKM